MTKTEARAAVRWFQKRAGLRHWTIELCLDDGAPEWVIHNEGTASGRGMLLSWTHQRHARIWACVNREMTAFEETGLHILFHEMVELAMRDSAVENSGAQAEWFIDRMADFAEAAYLAETNAD